MKICFVSHWSGSGGAEKVLYNLIALFRSHGLDVVATVPVEGSLRRNLTAIGVPCHLVRYRWWMGKDISVPKRIGRNVLNLFRAIELARLVRREGCDVVYSNTSTIHVGALAAWLTGRPHVWHIHEYGYEHGGMTYDLGIRLSTWIMDALTDRVMTVSDGIRDKYKRYLRPEKIVTVYNPIELPAGIAAEPRTDPRRFRIAIVGSLHEGKGQEQAIAALSRLTAAGVDAELMVIGDGEDERYKERLRALARDGGVADRVQMRGQLSDPYPAMKSADCLVMCSKFEGFSTVIIEAMLLGCPVIAANTGSVPEQIRDGVTGLLYEHGDVDALAGRLAYVQSHPAEVAAMTTRASDWAERTFRAERYFHLVHDLAAGVMSAAGRPATNVASGGDGTR